MGDIEYENRASRGRQSYCIRGRSYRYRYCIMHLTFRLMRFYVLPGEGFFSFPCHSNSWCLLCTGMIMPVTYDGRSIKTGNITLAPPMYPKLGRMTGPILILKSFSRLLTRHLSLLLPSPCSYMNIYHIIPTSGSLDLGSRTDKSLREEGRRNKERLPEGGL